MEIAVDPARATASTRPSLADMDARIVVVPLISTQYQALRRLSRDADWPGPSARSSVAAAEHRITAPAVSAGLGAGAAVGQQRRLGVDELHQQGRHADIEAGTGPGTHFLAQCYRQYYAPDNSQYQFASSIIISGSTECTQISSSNSNEHAPIARSVARSMTLQIRSQAGGIVPVSTVPTVRSSAKFPAPRTRRLTRASRAVSEQIVGGRRVISRLRSPVPTASRAASTATSRRAAVVAPGQFAEAGRVLRLGLVFALMYLVFLISWFWATRGRRRRAGELRLERGLE